ncbi:PspA/IM30 family protein [Paenibacillus aurantiacus]|uniref:PspA/IM30 family protein n=1 Tax=Paenibacillus aurantiacus TaxID=1936118 RepID=A0ABV5KNX8_9BACL
MGVFERIVNLTKAAAHEVLEKLESPVLMMNQYIRDAEQEIGQVQAEIARQEAAARGFKQQHAEHTRLAEHYEAKAAEALAADREAEAREALAAKLHYAEKAALQLEWHHQALARKDELTYKLDSAKAELEVMVKKRTELVARVEQAEAKARTSMPSFSSGPSSYLEGGSAARGFQRMEEKIHQLEARLELSGKQAPYAGTPYGSHGAYGTPASAGVPAAADPAKEALIAEQLELLRKKQASE